MYYMKYYLKKFNIMKYVILAITIIGFKNTLFLCLQLLQLIYVLSLCKYTWAEHCGGNGESLKYLWGDALSDSLDCIGPNGKPYPE